MTLNIVPFALCLLFIYRCIYSFQTLYGKFMVELQTGYWILFHKILPQSYVVVAVHSLTVCTLYSLHTTLPWTCIGWLGGLCLRTAQSMAMRLADTSCRALQCSRSRSVASRLAKAPETGLAGPAAAMVNKQKEKEIEQ